MTKNILDGFRTNAEKYALKGELEKTLEEIKKLREYPKNSNDVLHEADLWRIVYKAYGVAIETKISQAVSFSEDGFVEDTTTCIKPLERYSLESGIGLPTRYLAQVKKVALEKGIEKNFGLAKKYHSRSPRPDREIDAYVKKIEEYAKCLGIDSEPYLSQLRNPE